MREIRLSIPVVGGVTVVYTKEEVDKRLAQAKVRVSSAINKTMCGAQRLVKGLASNLSQLADKLDSK